MTAKPVDVSPGKDYVPTKMAITWNQRDIVDRRYELQDGLVVS